MAESQKMAKSQKMAESQNMNVLRKHKEELMLAIEKIYPLEQLANSLHKKDMILRTDYENFSSLDPDSSHVHPSLRARYLLHVALIHIEKKHTHVVVAFVKLLSEYEAMKSVCYNMLKEIVGNAEETISVKTRCDDDDSLQEKHINILAKILVNVSFQWEEIGIVLCLTRYELEECSNGKTNFTKFYKVLYNWYKKGSNVNFRTLKNALKSTVVGQIRESEDVTENFRTEVLAEVPSHTQPQTGIMSTDCLDDFQVTDGKSTLLEAPTGHDELAKYCWSKDGDPLCEGARYSGVCHNILLIKKACQGIGGNYSCSIKGSNDTIVTKNLSVIFSPEKKKLLEKYSEIQEIIKKDSWPPVGTSNYIKLALINEERPIDKVHNDSVQGDMDDILKEKTNLEYRLLFEKYEKGGLILVEGRPGSGKTTLTRKLSKDWATKPDILQEVNLLFLISLRIINTKNTKTLADILKLFYSNDRQRNEIMNMIETTNGKGCCFIIDGYDEYKKRIDLQNILNKLIYHTDLSNAMIIVASRPIGTVELRRNEKISKQIEVLGFSKESILSYIKSYFSENKHSNKKAEDLIQYLKHHINLLHLCYLPVHAAMICFIYQQPYEDIPVTETKMYEYFTLLTIKRKLENDGNPQEYDTLSELDGVIQESFKIVCKIAFDMTIQSKQTITMSPGRASLSKHDSDVHSLGLVTVDKTAKLFGMKDLYSFLHLTFQEFLAAYHIHICPLEKKLDIIKENVDNKEMLMVWKFFCGTSSFESHHSGLKEIMQSKYSNDLYRIQCAFESQQKKVCDLILENSETRSLQFNDQAFLPTDFNALAYTCSQTSFPATRLAFNSCILDETGAQTFIHEVNLRKLKHITSLSFSIKTNNKDQYKAIKLLLKNCHSLTELCLENLEIGPEEIEVLTNDIKLPYLKCLGIHMPLREAQLSRKCTCEKILPKLSFSSSKLEKIKYTYDEYSNETHKKCLIHLLKSFKCKIEPLCETPIYILSNIDVQLARVPQFLKISQLVLVNCNLSDADLHHIKNLDHVKMEKLRLDFNKLTCRGSPILSQLLHKCTKLTHMSLACNMIANEGAMALCRSLVPSSKLLELDLEGNSFGDQAALALAKSADRMCDDFRLKLGSRQISGETRRKIVESSLKVEMDEEREVSMSKIISLSHPDPIERVVQCYKNKYTLNLSNRRFCNSAADAIAQGIKHLRFLQTLDLSNCESSKMNALLKNISACYSLRRLNLNRNKISKDTIIKSIEGLKSCHHLTELNLGSNEIKDDGVQCVVRHLNDISIEILDLSNNGVTPDGAAALTRWLQVDKIPLVYEKDHVPSKYVDLDQFLHQKLNCVEIEFDSGIHGKQKHQWCSSLVELDLSGNSIGSKGAAALAYGLKCCYKLEILNLQKNQINYDGSEVLFHGLKDCSSLKSLKLDNNSLLRLGEPFHVFGISVHLQELTLSENNIKKLSEHEAKILLQGLSSCSDLKILNLDNNPIGLHGARALGEAIKSLTKLEQLGIMNVGRNSGIIMKGIKNNYKLKSLNLKKNILDLGCFKLLGKSTKHDQLVQLILTNTRIHKLQGAQFLSEGLKHCPKMQILDLSSNELDSNDIQLLSTGIATCSDLISLDLSTNNFDSFGACDLAKGINGFSNLRSINVKDNNIGSKGGVPLMKAIVNSIELEQLQFQRNKIGPRGAAAIADWIISTSRRRPRQISGLLVLNIGTNDIKDEGAQALATALKSCGNLSFLSLSDNKIGFEASASLATGLKQCSQLVSLYLNDNMLDADGVNLLCEGLQCCQSLKNVSLEKNFISSKVPLNKSLTSNHRFKKIYISYEDDTDENDDYENVIAEDDAYDDSADEDGVEDHSYENDPRKTTPMKTTPMKMTPMKPTSMKTTPMKMTPMKTTPMKTTPMKTTPMKPTSMKTTPMKTTPMKTTPVTTPMKTTRLMKPTSMKTTPMKPTSMKTTPMKTAPMTTSL